MIEAWKNKLYERQGLEKTNDAFGKIIITEAMYLHIGM